MSKTHTKSANTLKKMSITNFQTIVFIFHQVIDKQNNCKYDNFMLKMKIQICLI